MGYIYVEKDGIQAQYLITSTAAQPRLVIGEHGYVPLVMGTTNAPMLKYAPADGYETLRAGSYTSTTVKSTSSSVGSSYIGCAGTSSSSGSTLDTTIQASTAISFTSTSAFTRSSTSGYNGLSNADAQTCESTSSWAGSSTKQSNYQTTLANSVGLSSSTALTRESIYGYEDCVSTTGWDYPQAYQITRTWYDTLNRTTGYSGYSVGWVYQGDVIGCFTFSGYNNSYYRSADRFYYTYYRNDGGRFTCLSFDNACGWVDIVSAKYYMTNGVSNIGGGRFGNAGNNFYDYDYVEDIADGEYNRDNDRKDGVFESIIALDDNRKTVYISGVTYNTRWNAYQGGFNLFCQHGYGNGEEDSYERNYHVTGNIYAKATNYFTAANTAGMQGVTELTENYLDYNNPQYDYGWVVTNTVARTCRVTTRTLTRESISSWKGISSRQSYYQTTLANSAGLSSVTALTRSSTSAYTGITHRRSDYTSSQANNYGMTNATALTCYSTTAYAGISSRASNYNTLSVNVGNLSYTTALTRYGVTHTYTATTESYTTFTVVSTQQATRSTMANTGSGHKYSAVTFTYAQSAAVNSGTTFSRSTTVSIYGSLTTGYSGISSKQSDYGVTQPSTAGIWNTTALTGVYTTGYSGQLSRWSQYDTTIPNDGQNALSAQALTCVSTSQWGGKSSTSESISSTELRTSYFTSGYTESTTISVTDRVLTTTVYSDTVTVQSSSLSSGNGYKIVGGAIVVDQGGYAYYTVESYSTYGQSTFVVVAESMETTTLRTSTYTRVSQAIMSYGARTSLSTYINTNTYIETIWGYM